MTPKERLDHCRAIREKTRHQQEAGELITSADYERQMASVLKILATTIESLPDVLERDSGITGEAIEKAQWACDRMREDLYQRLIELTREDQNASE